jgi:dolichyl-phosphate-mannose-protein mannosyltransferase
VRNKDVVQLVHLSTNTALLSHDVASSLMATNQEFTTMDRMNEQRFNDTLFEIVLADGDNEATWKTKSGHFRLIHWPTRVAMWTHNKPLLPDWAFKQQEINGNKNSNDKTAIWYVDEIVQDERKSYPRYLWPPVSESMAFAGGMQPHDRGNNEAKKEPKRLSFLWKFAELQSLMLQHNAGLTASHPYASAPLNWPFLLSGISFWTEGEAQKQIYMIGNIVSWWTCVVALSIYVGIVGADILARRRELYPLTDGEGSCPNSVRMC